ncbi:hypothetical protein N7535_004211 [Penicillium sp. DV-2018c]|nr:hypothetical protein N7535_004211 [Penicillium sp. DV-2018c]
MGSPQALRAACDDPDILFDRSDEELIHFVRKEFPQEFDRLRRACSIRDCPSTSPSTPSPSSILYHKEHDQVNRTFAGILALRWLHTGQYETFIGSQSPECQLTLPSFNWIRQFYTKTITDANELFALIISTVIRNLGKDPQLASDCRAQTGKDISALNSDAILLAACKAGLVPSLARLQDQDRDDVLRMIELGATFNFGQFARAENAPVSLNVLRHFKDHDRAFRLRFMHELIEVAGAAGHKDWTCAKELTQPTFESYRDVYDACGGVIEGTLSVGNAYDMFLRQKDVRLFDIENNPDDMALMRLLCMGNVATNEKALLYEEAWRALEDPVRESLRAALNLEGKRGEPAVQPSYMSALLGRMQDVDYLVCALCYLARIMSARDVADPSALVIERSLYEVLEKVVDSKEFRNDPCFLEKVDVPDGVVILNTAMA